MLSEQLAIKAVVFDMDGVMLDARDWHFHALNEALRVFGTEIDYEDHLRDYDGLPTRVKLNMLSDSGLLPEHLHDTVSAIKQERTVRQAAMRCFPRVEHLIMLSWLKVHGVRLGLATNSIRSTTLAMLQFAGVLGYFDSVLTNEDVSRPKPDPEIYLSSCVSLHVSPRDTLVVEDHLIGVSSARDAGCTVMQISEPADLSLGSLRLFMRTNGIRFADSGGISV